jgi:hypothetical protein
VTLALGPASFQVFGDASSAWKTIAGTYRIFVGSSSRSLPLQDSVKLP